MIYALAPINTTKEIPVCVGGEGEGGEVGCWDLPDWL